MFEPQPLPPLDPAHPRRMLLIASTGGHLAQLVRLAPGLGASDDSLWVTHAGPQSDGLLAGRNVLHVPYVTSRDARGVAVAARQIARRIKGESFEVAVSTGAALALSGLGVARARKIPTLYIESVSRVDGPSLSGKIIAATRAAHLRTQHSTWADERWIAHPPVLATYRSLEDDDAAADPTGTLDLFVTLGTTAFPFDSALERILSLGIAGPGSVWQLGATPVRDDLPGTVVTSMSSAEFDARASAADVVVTHAGVGTLLGLLEQGIHPVAVIRRRSRAEHVDDHQEQIATLLNRYGIGFGVEVDELDEAVLRNAARRRVVEGAQIP